MKVFITGGTGFVGKALISRLLSLDHEVVALLLPNDAVELPSAASVVRADITKPETLSGILSGSNAVIHLAGVVGYGKDWGPCIRVNVDGTRNLAQEAVSQGVRRFIHMSSVSVYGRVANAMLSESAPLVKTGDPYGDTKIDAELVLRSMERELDLTILRPTVIYGPGDDKFLPKLVENLESGSARVIGSGNNSVDLIHVDDVVDFVVSALSDGRTHGEAFNLNHPANGTWRDLLRLSASTLGADEPTKKLPYPAALLVSKAMVLVSRFTGRPPRLTPYAVRVVGRQYNYQVDKALRLGMLPKVAMSEGIVREINRLRA